MIKINLLTKVKKNDPGSLILKIVAKVAIVMVIYCTLALSFKCPHEVITWTLYFLSFIAMACATGDIQTRRKIFILFSLGFSLILIFSVYLYHLNKLELIIFIIFATYSAFWLQKFGRAFRLFPGFLIVLALSSVQLPITSVILPNLLLSLLFSGSLFFILVLLWLPRDIPLKLKRILQSNMFEMQKTILNVLKSIENSEYNIKSILETQHSAVKRIHIMQKKGNGWIIIRQRRSLWQKNCNHCKLSIRYLFRLLIFYNIIMSKSSQKIKTLTKKSSLNEVLLSAIILLIYAVNLKLEKDFENQWLKFDKKKTEFKNFVLTQEQKIKGCRTLLFDMIFLLENLSVIAKQWQRDINALV